MNLLSLVSQGGIDYYDVSPDSYLAAQVGRNPTAAALKLADQLRPDSLVVDAGCGTGVETTYFCSRGFQVYAYDASAEMVKATRAVVNPLCPHIYQHRHDELSLERKADAIYAGASLLFLSDEDLTAALRVLADNLVPGGVFATFFKEGAEHRDAGDGRVFHDKRVEDLADLAQRSGLEPLEAYVEPDALGRPQNWVAFWLRKPT
jgi:trans-aconitate methyltransferase